MPDRLSARTVLAILLVLLAIAGIRAAGPPVPMDIAARPVVIVTGCVLEAVLAGLLVALRWRSRAASGPAARLRPLLSAAIVTGLIAVPLAVVLLLARVARRPFQLPRNASPAPRPATPPGQHPLHATTAAPDFRYLLMAAVAVAILVAAILIWRQRRSRRDPAGQFTDPDEADTGTPAELARAVDFGRMALRELDDARAAIIRCYLAMEGSLAEAGAARGIAETPDELLGRAVAAGLVPAGPAGRLTALFYEARFSTHPMPLSRLQEAEQALAELATTLPQQADTLTGAGPAAGEQP
jgi:Domain of unknown function (DUF4129)